MSTLHVGHHIVQAISSAVGPVPAGTLTVAQVPNGIVGIAIDPTTNAVTLTGVTVGNTAVTYSAPGFTSTTINVSVSAAPSIIVTDGPEV